MVTSLVFYLMMTKLVLVSFLAVDGLSSSQLHISVVEEEPKEEGCPPCELFFHKLDKNEETGNLAQVVRVQERGEPKSGTGMMFDWATGALDQMCKHLQLFYGRESCVLDFKPPPEIDGDLPARPVTRRMVFEPALGASEARCPCETIERVSVVLSKNGKHGLPVDRLSCAFSHNAGIELAPDVSEHRPEKSACTFADGTRPKHYEDLWRCMHEANCEITDDWLQFVVFRDPRPAVVSSYFHLKLHSKRELGELEEFVARELPIICQWLTVRHVLFSGFLLHQSIEFWYNDAMADPLEWYYHFFYSVGLQLPYQAVNNVAEAAGANELSFRHKQVDKHPGEEPRNYTGVRKFENEVSPETRKAADDILRQWLPHVLLERLGVGPSEEQPVR